MKLSFNLSVSIVLLHCKQTYGRIILIFHTLVAALLSIFWLIITRNFSIENYIVGFVISIPLSMLTFKSVKIPIWRIPIIVANVIYHVIHLYVRIFISGIQLTIQIFSPDMKLKTGIIAVNTQDDTNNEWITGLSAHAISAMPGDLVIDFSEDEKIMYVHTLDVDASEKYLFTDQVNRLKVFYRIFGRDVVNNEPKNNLEDAERDS